MLKHWLRFGGRWRSPYHRIAYELASPKKASTVRRLLEYGFVNRAAELLKIPSLSTPSSEARLAFLTGKPEVAKAVLLQALKTLSANHPEQRRIIKLLTRLAPESVVIWAREAGHERLATQIEAAIAPQPHPNFLTLNRPKEDEHLLIANANNSARGKLESLNAFFKEKKMLPVTLKDAEQAFNINNLSSPPEALPVKKAPYVSVIMTVYNGEEFIRSAALSILHQIGVKVELIIIDDGSTDGTWRAIDALVQQYPGQVHAKKLPENIGTYKAKNIALNMCTGDYIAFQDADDWSHPQRLAHSIAWIRSSPNRVAATCRYVRLDTNARFYSPGVWPLHQWSPNTLVFRRLIVLRKIGKFEEVRAGADTEYFERIRLIFGDQYILFSKRTLLIAMSLPASLMHSEKTGVDKTGYSLSRISYRETQSENLLRSIAHTLQKKNHRNNKNL